MKRVNSVGRVIVAGLLTGFGTLPAFAAAQTNRDAADSSAAVTYAKDVAPIFREKCETCHRNGSIGPMSLTTYEEARPWARSIRTRVASRDMPPWHLDKTVGIQRFINDRSLSDAEIETILKWVDSGAPLGNVADLPPARQWPNDDRFELEATLGPPDLIVKADSFTMPAQSPDVSFKSLVPLPLTTGRWVRAAETRPSPRGRPIAHHSSTYIRRPTGEAALEAERKMRAGQATIDLSMADRTADFDPAEDHEFFTEWAQGKGGETYPAGVGKLLMPGSTVEFDIHYHAVGEEITDQMEVAWWFYPEGETPRLSADFILLGRVAELQIPPNTIAQHQGVTVLKAPAMLHNFQPHMHYRGKAFLLEAIYPDGRREQINYVDRYSNTWHINYIYDPDYAPIFPAGTVLQITTWHDNTSANKNNPDPRQWVAGGPRTVDEMSHANTQLIYLTEADYDRIVEERKARQAARTQN